MKRERRQIGNVGVTAKEPDNSGYLTAPKYFYILIVVNISQIYRHIWMYSFKSGSLKKYVVNLSRVAIQKAPWRVSRFSLNNKNKQVLCYLHCIIPLL